MREVLYFVLKTLNGGYAWSSSSARVHQPWRVIRKTRHVRMGNEQWISQGCVNDLKWTFTVGWQSSLSLSLVLIRESFASHLKSVLIGIELHFRSTNAFRKELNSLGRSDVCLQDWLSNRCQTSEESEIENEIFPRSTDRTRAGLSVQYQILRLWHLPETTPTADGQGSALICFRSPDCSLVLS